jgi:hypothetical protein
MRGLFTIYVVSVIKLGNSSEVYCVCDKGSLMMEAVSTSETSVSFY